MVLHLIINIFYVFYEFWSDRLCYWLNNLLQSLRVSFLFWLRPTVNSWKFRLRKPSLVKPSDVKPNGNKVAEKGPWVLAAEYVNSP